MEKPLYFAYGSNINLDQMRYRCPDATVYGQAVLDNYDLRFRGSGVSPRRPCCGASVPSAKPLRSMGSATIL